MNTSTRASKILRESRKEYQSILQKNISKQTGKKNVCKAAKEASKQYDKMSWPEALRIAASNGTGTKKVKKTAPKPKPKKSVAVKRDRSQRSLAFKKMVAKKRESVKKNRATFKDYSYLIDEKTERNAHDMNSFREFKPRSKNEYYSIIEDKNNVISRILSRDDLSDNKKDEIVRKFDVYNKRLAELIDKQNRIDAQYPSVMVAGPAKFNYAKKEKQNAARRAVMDERKNNESFFDRFTSSESLNRISSGDEDATSRITAKIEAINSRVELIKKVNAYIRKNNTIEGFPGLKADIKEDYYYLTNLTKRPYQFDTTNLTAERRRLEARLKSIQNKKEIGESRDFEIEGGEVKFDSGDSRIRILFDSLPDSELRSQLKHNGFVWSPKNKAWQRQYTANGIYALKKLLKDGVIKKR